MGEPNLFKLKYRNTIQTIVRKIILDKVPATRVVATIKNLIATEQLSISGSAQVFQMIETEFMSLHEGNRARFKIQPSEFARWKKTSSPDLMDRRKLNRKN